MLSHSLACFLFSSRSSNPNVGAAIKVDRLSFTSSMTVTAINCTFAFWLIAILSMAYSDAYIDCSEPSIAINILKNVLLAADILNSVIRYAKSLVIYRFP